MCALASVFSLFVNRYQFGNKEESYMYFTCTPFTTYSTVIELILSSSA